MIKEITYCPFCHTIVVPSEEQCSHCGATIEYGRIPPRYYLFLLILIWVVIAFVHLLCDDLGIVSFLVQLWISTLVWLIIWIKSIKALNKKYKGRVRYVRSMDENGSH